MSKIALGLIRRSWRPSRLIRVQDGWRLESRLWLGAGMLRRYASASRKCVICRELGLSDTGGM